MNFSFTWTNAEIESYWGGIGLSDDSLFVDLPRKKEMSQKRHPL